jgi:hypothetical protein
MLAIVGVAPLHLSGVIAALRLGQEVVAGVSSEGLQAALFSNGKASCRSCGDFLRRDS